MHLSFDSMLAEPGIPALPVSQQLQVVRLMAFQCSSNHRRPSAIMCKLSYQNRMGQRKTEVFACKQQQLSAVLGFATITSESMQAVIHSTFVNCVCECAQLD